MDLIAQIKLISEIATLAQLLQVKGQSGYGDPVISKQSWDILQDAINQLPNELRAKYAGIELI